MNTDRDREVQITLAEEIGDDFIDAHLAPCIKCGEEIGLDTTFYVEKDGGYIHAKC